MLTISGHFWTTYLLHLVNVVCERPLMLNLGPARETMFRFNSCLESKEHSEKDVQSYAAYAQWLLLGIFAQKGFKTNLNFRYQLVKKYNQFELQICIVVLLKYS